MFDPADCGVIKPEPFIKILGNFGFAQRDAAMIFEKYDQDNSGSIDIREFQKLLFAPPPPAFSTLAMAESKQKAKKDHTMMMAKSMKEGGSNLTVEQVEERLKVKIEHRLGNLWNRETGQLGERRAFSLFNPVEGHIYPAEFVRIMDGFGFSKVDSMKLFHKYDVNRSGSIDVDEFKHMVFGNRARPLTVSHITQPVKRHGSVSSGKAGSAWGMDDLENLGIGRPISRGLSRPGSQAGFRSGSKSGGRNIPLISNRASSAMSGMMRH